MNSVSASFPGDSKLGSISNSEIREASPRYLKGFEVSQGILSEIQPKKMQANTSTSK